MNIMAGWFYLVDADDRLVDALSRVQRRTAAPWCDMGDEREWFGHAAARAISLGGRVALDPTD